ncbi:hypothetical protein J6590_028802 [Homalodisca vitripennis]|nr:hypothetical protein J6590_028802 [Homalodisca vitripennis]
MMPTADAFARCNFTISPVVKVRIIRVEDGEDDEDEDDSSPPPPPPGSPPPMFHYPPPPPGFMYVPPQPFTGFKFSVLNCAAAK